MTVISIVSVPEVTADDQSLKTIALFSCFVNGEPAAAIVAINRDGGNYAIRPLFVSVTPSLTLTDHDG